MLNKDKYDTAQMAWKGFTLYCTNTRCRECPFFGNKSSCYFAWLYADEQIKKTPSQWKQNIIDKFTSKE